jgi:flagellar basal body-associated protein FliL
MSEKTWIMIILVILGLIIIAYAVVMFEVYTKKKWIFSPTSGIDYTPPGTYFYPTGDIKMLTPEEKEARAQAIKNYLDSLE